MWQRFKNVFGRLPFAQVSTGARGEKAAEAFLKSRGYRVVARNWRNPRDRRDEIDLVCEDGAVLVFVEVKTRAGDALVQGYHAVDARKKKVVLRTAAAYLRRLAARPATFRFDVVEVSTRAEGEGAPEIRHFENVPLFPKHFRP